MYRHQLGEHLDAHDIWGQRTVIDLFGAYPCNCMLHGGTDRNEVQMKMPWYDENNRPDEKPKNQLTKISEQVAVGMLASILLVVFPIALLAFVYVALRILSLIVVS